VELRPPPTTREVIKKFVKTYKKPSEYILNSRISKKEEIDLKAIMESCGLEKLKSIRISNEQ